MEGLGTEQGRENFGEFWLQKLVSCSNCIESSRYCRDDFSSTKNMYKCYILLFTCCVTRAVHLEVRVDVNSTSIILALRQFIARRGVPRLLMSHNFKSFKLLDIKFFCCKQGISWKFILERSPWWGGF